MAIADTAATWASDSWFVPLRADAESAVRMFAFPHAGAGPGSMASLAAACAPQVDLWAANLPGRQARQREPARTDLEPLVDDLADAVATHAGERFTLFGYCSGALLAYLVARRLDTAGVVAARLFVGSMAAPDVAEIPRRLHLLPSELFWQQLPAQGGASAELAARRDMRPVFEPALRADFALVAGYRHRSQPPMSIPITVLYGDADTLLSRGGLLGWRRQTSVGVDLREIGGSHWLLDEAVDHVARAIVTASLRDPLQPPAADEQHASE